MTNNLAVKIAGVLLLFASSIAVRTGIAASVETIDAEKIICRIISLSDEELIYKESGQEEKTFPRQDVFRIGMGRADDILSAKETENVIVTIGGDVIGAKELTLKDGKLKFFNSLLAQAIIDISLVRAIYHPIEMMTVRDIMQKGRERNLVDADMDMDVLVVFKMEEKKDDAKDSEDEKGKPPTPASGEPTKEKEIEKVAKWYLFEGVMNEIFLPQRAKPDDMISPKVLFTYEETEKTISYRQVPAIFFAAPAKKSKTLPAGKITGKDGTVLLFSTLTIKDGNALAEIASAGKVSIPVEKIASIDFNSSQMDHLSKLKPSAVSERGFFRKTFKHKLDRSVGGEKMRLDGIVYDRGVGMHSHSSITYDLDEKYSLFVAIVGIDDSVRPMGDAQIKISADGKPLLEPTNLTGKTPPQEIRLDVTGVKKMTIEVDFGTDKLGIADHVDIARARLIKKP